MSSESEATAPNPLLITTDPGAKELAEKLRQQSNRPVAKRFTVDGEVIVMGLDGRYVELPLEADVLPPDPPGFDAEHQDIMGLVYTAVQQIKENKTRTVPLTRGELFNEMHADKKKVAQLEKWGYLKSRVISLTSSKTGKKTGARAIYYFTPKGRAYVRSKFDEHYALPSPNSGGDTKRADSPQDPSHTTPAETSGGLQS